MALTPSEIESYRETLDQTLGEPGVALIEARTLAGDGMGGFTESWGTVGSYDCRFKPDPGEEAVRGGALAAIGKGVVTLPAETPIVPANRLSIAGTAYEVISVEVHSWDLCVRATVEDPSFGGS